MDKISVSVDIPLGAGLLLFLDESYIRRMDMALLKGNVEAFFPLLRAIMENMKRCRDKMNVGFLRSELDMVPGQPVLLDKWSINNDIFDIRRFSNLAVPGKLQGSPVPEFRVEPRNEGLWTEENLQSFEQIGDEPPPLEQLQEGNTKEILAVVSDNAVILPMVNVPLEVIEEVKDPMNLQRLGKAFKAVRYLKFLAKKKKSLWAHGIADTLHYCLSQSGLSEVIERKIKWLYVALNSYFIPDEEAVWFLGDQVVEDFRKRGYPNVDEERIKLLLGLWPKSWSDLP